MSSQNLREPWRPGQSGNPKGRPKNRVPEQLAVIFGSKARAKRFYNLSGDEIDSWEKAVLAMSADPLKLLAKWSDAPTYPKGLAVAILTDMKNGRTATLDKLRERQYGKPAQRIDVSGGLSFESLLMQTGVKDDDDNGGE